MKKEIAGRRVIVLVVLVITAVTLRAGGGGSGSTGCLICGVRGLADFISNIILFAPLGCAVAMRKGKLWHALLLGLALSLSIELAQWRLVAGRDANLGDLVANGTGALLGWTLVRLRPWRPLAHGSAIRSYGVAWLTSGLLLVALTLFGPRLSRSTYYLHWTPAYESLERYPGTVLRTKLGSMEWVEGPHSRLEQPDSVGGLLSRVPLELEFMAGPATASLAPIISISDEEQEEVLMIGADGGDLIYRFNSRANDLRLDDVDLRVPQVLRELRPGDTAVISMRFDQQGYCIELNSDTRCGHGVTIGDTWALLLNPHWRPAVHRAFGIFWLWLAFLPVGMVTPNTRRLALVAAGAATALWLGPTFLGFAVTPLYQIVGVLFGHLAGAALGSRLNPTTPVAHRAETPGKLIRHGGPQRW
ncbi:MAG TPA: VanZ family protein [Longimicrobiales bacterium]